MFQRHKEFTIKTTIKTKCSKKRGHGNVFPIFTRGIKPLICPYS